MKKRVIICVGGTGGHVYPAIALANQLTKKNPDLEILFVGGSLSRNVYFKGQAFNYHDVSCGSFVNKNPIKLLKSCLNIVRGIWESGCIIRNYTPNIIIGFGSYYTLPTLLAAKFLRTPIFLHEANSIPGKVNRLLSKYVTMTGIHFPETAALLSGPTIKVDMPLREGFRLGVVTQSEAREYYQLNKQTLTILVFGGSQGAKSINHLFSHALTYFDSEQKKSIQVIHFTGDAKQSHEMREMYALHGIKSCVKDFESRMEMAWTAADLVISRAGASTIAEQMEFNVPGILIPFPLATDQHQDKNADFIVTKVGGSLKFKEATLTAEKLYDALIHMLASERALLKSMKKAIQLHKKQFKNKKFSSLICDFIERKA